MQSRNFVEQWMGTKVLKLENKKHGSYRFETTDPKGNKHGFNGTIHEFSLNQKITRTFEFENTPFGVQLEVLEFEQLTDDNQQANYATQFLNQFYKETKCCRCLLLKA
jgi:uncharacterized protein YndB with AHSA1/START domain